MKTSVSVLLAIAATFLVRVPAFADPANVPSSMIIADIGRDTIDMAASPEVMPTVSDLIVEFPELEKERGVTGTTIVAVLLDDHDKLVGTSIYRSSGSKLIDAWATYGVRRASFKSGTIAGKPVGGRYAIRVEFNADH